MSKTKVKKSVVKKEEELESNVIALPDRSEEKVLEKKEVFPEYIGFGVKDNKIHLKHVNGVEDLHTLFTYGLLFTEYVRNLIIEERLAVIDTYIEPVVNALKNSEALNNKLEKLLKEVK